MWPFTRKPKPLNPGPINEDWRVGDLAECMLPIGWGWAMDADGPDRGDVCRVVHVYPGITTGSGEHAWFLLLKGFHDGFATNSFRKVPPLNSEASAEFTASIRACRPTPAKVDAA